MKGIDTYTYIPKQVRRSQDEEADGSEAGACDGFSRNVHWSYQLSAITSARRIETRCPILPRRADNGRGMYLNLLFSLALVLTLHVRP